MHLPSAEFVLGLTFWSDAIIDYKLLNTEYWKTFPDKAAIEVLKMIIAY